MHKTANVLNKLPKSQNRKLSEPLGNYSGIEACNEVGQTLALDQYVIPEALLRPRRVASEDRIDDILVRTWPPTSNAIRSLALAGA